MLFFIVGCLRGRWKVEQVLRWWLCGVVASTLDFESDDLGSNPSMIFVFANPVLLVLLFLRQANARITFWLCGIMAST